MALFVAVAHNGKTLQLGVQPAQRVEAVQQALVTFTGIPVAEQIIMLAGTKLDSSRPLSAYKLPVDDPNTAADHPVILYCKSYLRPDGPVPPAESLAPITPRVPPPLDSATLTAAVANHPLSHSPHAVVKALPRHEAAFSHHVAKAAAYMEASLARLHRCRQLLSEQEVQSRAADAATGNVESHYTFISQAMAAFTAKYNQQCVDHAQLLASFSEDQALLDTIPLHPALQTQPPVQPQQQPQQSGVAGAAAAGAGGAGPVRKLSELPGAVRAREMAAACRKHHGQFAEKVTQLEGVYESMKLDMEALIMQAPSVDLDALGVQLVEAEGWVEEQSAIVQVLRKDLTTLQQLVERVVRQSAAGGGAMLQSPAAVADPPASAPAGDSLLDACVAVGALANAHEATQLPRMESLDAAIAVLEERCAAAKARMTTDVVKMLQCISQQQSKIRDMRSRLAGFDALLQRQAAMFNELRPLGRLPAAYRALLAECERVRAWHQLKSSQVTEFVDQLVADYQSESRKRRALLQQVERYLPAELLGLSGLQDAAALGLPTISLPPPPMHLLPVSLQDVQRVPGGAPGVSTAMAAMSQLLTAGPQRLAGSSSAAAGEEQLLLSDNAGEEPGNGGFAPPLPDPTSMHRLEMENARLRMEMAGLLAEAALARLQQQPAAAPPAATPLSGSLIAVAGAARGLGASQLGAVETLGAAGKLPSGRALGSSTSWRRPSQTSGAGAAAAASPHGTSVPSGVGAIAHSRSHSLTPGQASQLSLGASPSLGASTVLGAGAAPAPGASLASQQSSPLPAAAAPAGQGLQQPGLTSRHSSSVGATPPSPGMPAPAGPAPWAAGPSEQQQAALEAVAALQQAAAAKDALCSTLQHEVRALTRRIGTYEDRIIQLEERLAKNALAASVAEPPPASPGGSAQLQPPADTARSQPEPSTAATSGGPQQQQQEQADATDDFDPLASSSCGDCGADTVAQDAAETAGGFGTTGDMSGIATRSIAAPPPAAELSSGGLPVAAQPSTPPVAAAGAGLGSVATQLSPHSMLGPIALAAMGVSRGQTPEPVLRFSSAQCSTGGSSAGGNGSNGGAVAGPTMPLLLGGSRTGTPDGGVGWESGGPLRSAPWPAHHPHPLFRGPWVGGASGFDAFKEAARTVSAAAVEVGLAGAPRVQETGRRHSLDGALPAVSTAVAVPAAPLAASAGQAATAVATTPQASVEQPPAVGRGSQAVPDVSAADVSGKEQVGGNDTAALPAGHQEDTQESSQEVCDRQDAATTATGIAGRADEHTPTASATSPSLPAAESMQTAAVTFPLLPAAEPAQLATEVTPPATGAPDSNAAIAPTVAPSAALGVHPAAERLGADEADTFTGISGASGPLVPAISPAAPAHSMHGSVVASAPGQSEQTGSGAAAGDAAAASQQTGAGGMSEEATQGPHSVSVSVMHASTEAVGVPPGSVDPSAVPKGVPEAAAAAQNATAVMEDLAGEEEEEEEDTEDDAAVPDINDVMPSDSPDGGLLGEGGTGGTGSPGVQGGAGEGGADVRTWPAAGSGLGDSVFEGGQGRAEGGQQGSMHASMYASAMGSD